MKPFLEFEGKNVNKAVKTACSELNIDKKDLEYDVLSSGSSGIFGLVRIKNAKIRVKLSKAQENTIKASEKIDVFSSEGVSSLVDEAFGDTGSKSNNFKSSNNKPIAKNSFTGKPDGNKYFGKGTTSSNITENTATERPEFPRSFMHKEPVSDEIEALGLEVLRKITDLITDDAVITVKNDIGRLSFNIEGGKSAMLIGRRGQTLEALQYLVDKIVNKQSDYRIRVQIDVEGYLDTRRDNLKSLARKLAEKAKYTGKSTTIGQMNAHDRRIVHLTLKDDKGIRTQSMGDGYYRRLVIFPRKSQYRNKKQAQPYRPYSQRTTPQHHSTQPATNMVENLNESSVEIPVEIPVETKMEA
ncbi:MAG: hypothetical protein B6I31_02820 [Desulfobacteraceae bacterium 4572_19]|nr:MAG: hypothetical protein B6I31_02820 [Desulfobacteraceae bacterium 4572_19]